MSMRQIPAESFQTEVMVMDSESLVSSDLLPEATLAVVEVSCQEDWTLRQVSQALQVRDELDMASLVKVSRADDCSSKTGSRILISLDPKVIRAAKTTQVSMKVCQNTPVHWTTSPDD